MMDGRLVWQESIVCIADIDGLKEKRVSQRHALTARAIAGS